MKSKQQQSKKSSWLGNIRVLAFIRENLRIISSCFLIVSFTTTYFLHTWAVAITHEYHPGIATAISNIQPSLPQPSLKISARQCGSPEINVTWPFGGCENTKEDAIDHQRHPVGKSRTSPTTCGFCNQSNNQYINYFRKLAAQLQAQRGSECSDLVVFGVAFGRPYMKMVILGDAVDDLDATKSYGICSFIFVLADELNDALMGNYKSYFSAEEQASRLAALVSPLSLNYTSRRGFDTLVPVQRDFLPYQSMRRNTKLFKMHGHLIFSWTDRVLWRDAKLKGKYAASKNWSLNISRWAYTQDYQRYYQDTIEKTKGNSSYGACVAFMGLPLHDSAVTKSSELKRVKYENHCDAIIKAAETRPTISDSIDTLARQCSSYMKGVGGISANRSINDTTKSLSTLLDAGMIDSALIAWDLRSQRCRKFIADQTCTWSDEIQCQSDRDQISFAQAFVSMDLHEKSDNGPSDPQTAHRLFVDPQSSHPNTPLVEIIKGDCHPYYGLSPKDCNFTLSGVSDMSPQPNAYSTLKAMTTSAVKTRDLKQRVAIVVAGSFRRFVFNSSIHRLVKPLSLQGHEVHYYVSLTTEDQPAYRASEPYMNHLTWDPIFDLHDEHDSTTTYHGGTGGNTTTTTDTMLRNEFIESVIRKHMVDAGGGQVRQVTLQPKVDIDSNKAVQIHRKLAMTKYPTEDPDTRFPAKDARGEPQKVRTANGNRNMLRLFLSLQELWKSVVDNEKKDGNAYDIVMFLRDDTLWMGDFNLNELLLSNGLADVYALSCDARTPPMAQEEMCDHIAIFSRSKAGLYGNYFDTLFSTDMDACASSIDEHIRGKNGLRGCNSEMIFKWILKKGGLSIQEVGQGLIPFQRSAMVKDPNDGSVFKCFHKYCQSHIDYLLDSGMGLCKQWRP